MLALIIPIIVSWYVYKTAKENGRSGIFWAILNFVAFWSGQFLFVLLAAGGIALSIALDEWDETIFYHTLDKWSLLIDFAGLIFGGILSYLIVRHVTRVPEEQFYPEPPAPPTFN